MDEQLKQEINSDALFNMGFVLCNDGKYRKTSIFDFMNLCIDEYGNLRVSAENETGNVEIPITMFNQNKLDKFKQWMALTHRL